MRHWFMAALLVCAGCENNGMQQSTDQCMSHEFFLQCLTAAPAGPKSTYYNDWAEMVEACDRVSRYQSARREQSIAPECRP